MTEDDTFRVLKRIPFLQMMELYRTNRPRPYKIVQYPEWFAEYGWTWDEFKKHWYDWNGGKGTTRE